MNSKEALESIRDYHNETVYDIDNIYTENMFEKELDIIEKDLEVLEILKNNLYEEKGTGRFKDCNTINCSLGNQHSGIDYTKVKEWLTNDNN